MLPVSILALIAASDIFKDEWPQIDKLSVCDDDTNLDGLGFIKRGFIFSINCIEFS